MSITAKEFKEKIEQYIELNFGCDLSSAGKRQLYQAVLGVTNEILAKKRYAFTKKAKEQEVKQVFYMSMEFLVGTSLRNNLWNLGIEDDIKNMLKENNFDIEELYEMEPDAGLGNGGLGRLASCYMTLLPLWAIWQPAFQSNTISVSSSRLLLTAGRPSSPMTGWSLAAIGYVRERMKQLR